MGPDALPQSLDQLVSARGSVLAELVLVDHFQYLDGGTTAQCIAGIGGAMQVELPHRAVGCLMKTAAGERCGNRHQSRPQGLAQDHHVGVQPAIVLVR